MSKSTAHELQSFESGGVRCDADFYTPVGSDPPWPAVVLANVFGAPRSWGLARFAKRFATAGLAACVFDYRHFGTSGGTPRRLVSPARQIEDWRAVLTHIRSMDVVDTERVAIWGTSFSGGHVIAVARDDPAISAVVSMVPFVDGRAVMAHQTDHLRSFERIRTFTIALADRIGGSVGLGPFELPIVSEPHGGGLVDTPGAKNGFLSLVPAGDEVVNRMPARVILDLPFYRPGIQVSEVDVPVHVVIADEDRLLPIEPMERLVDRLPEAKVHRVEAAHFEIHKDPWFEEVIERQVAFLTGALGMTD